MVTRTIESTVATVLCLNVQTCEPCNLTVEVAGTFKDEEKLMRAIKEAHESDTIKFVQIVENHTKQRLYGMTEEDFLTYAVEMPPRKTAEETED